MEYLTALGSATFLGTSAATWAAFLVLVAVLLVFDLGVLHRRDREIGVAESLWLSGGYVAVALAFGTWVAWRLGSDAGLDWFTGYFVEKSLSMDNVFVIALIFGYFAIPRQFQHRVLFWGILGAIVLRAVLIGAGAALVREFAWILYVFGAFLVVTGVKMLFASGDEPDLGRNPVLRLLRRRLNVTDEHAGNRFFVTRVDAATGRPARFATPLFLALVLVELADLVFAVDSVPAIFAITQDPFIVYTSNIFAILGLRALYFALAAMIDRFRYLKYALAAILVLVGAKIFAVNFGVKVPAALSLAVTLGLVAGGVLYSLWRTRRGGAATVPR